MFRTHQKEKGEASRKPNIGSKLGFPRSMDDYANPNPNLPCKH